MQSRPGCIVGIFREIEKIFEKRYDYWVGDRLIGYISEFFNEESLERV